MTMIADFLLACGAIGAALYCFVLSRRLRRFTDLEKGVGGAVAVMSIQVDDLSRTLNVAKDEARQSASRLADLNDRAEHAQANLELLLASLHDLPQELGPTGAKSAYFVRRPAELEKA
ncbi:hypothetical protein [Yoonia litorea]|uniref:Uncharacterized protein n=1 Tax=Yoonia litorea TaxID=1123755 RepID=A0A1I6MU69_9RHOB|nr:hypothetical protein [Yoonia litorea]SFS19262.1 hypothetical protein SAMN05444714_2138 [Yoonia litorea]